MVWFNISEDSEHKIQSHISLAEIARWTIVWIEEKDDSVCTSTVCYVRSFFPIILYLLNLCYMSSGIPCIYPLCCSQWKTKQKIRRLVERENDIHVPGSVISKPWLGSGWHLLLKFTAPDGWSSSPARASSQVSAIRSLHFQLFPSDLVVVAASHCC